MMIPQPSISGLPAYNISPWKIPTLNIRASSRRCNCTWQLSHDWQTKIAIPHSNNKNPEKAMAAASEIEIFNSNGKHIGSVSVVGADMTAAEFGPRYRHK
jgi:hypothetical protein